MIASKGNCTISLRKLVFIMIAIVPIIDSVNGMMITEFQISGVGSLYRIVYFFIIIAYILSRKIRKQAIISVISFVFFICIQIVVSKGYIGNSIELSVKLFIPIFMMYAFLLAKQQDERFQKDIIKALDIASLLFPITILLPFVLGIGRSTYRMGEGFKGFYYATNEITYAACVMVMFSWGQLMIKVTRKYFFRLGLNGIVCAIIGSKIAMGTVVFFVCLLGIHYLVDFLKGKKPSQSIIILCGGIASVIIVIALFRNQIDKIFSRWTTNKEAAESIISFLTSHRNVYVEQAFPLFLSGGISRLLFGWGMGGINNGMQNTEMDFFDLLFGSGIVGFIIILSIYIIILRSIRIRSWKARTLILVSIAISFFGGHVLFTGLGGMMLATLLAYSSTLEKKPKRRIRI